MAATPKQLNTRIQNKHDFDCNWKKATFIPFKGELIIYDRETNEDGSAIAIVVKDAEGNDVTRTACAAAGRENAPFTQERFKIGDGIRTPDALPFTDAYTFSTVRVGSVDISADVPTDTITFKAGENVVLTPNATTDEITIAAADTHYTAGMVVGSSASAKTNTNATNGNVYINLLDNNIVQASHKVVGSGGTTVTSDGSGHITVNTTLYTNKGQNINGAMTQKAVSDAIDSLITCGTADPTTSTVSQFYFKYSE
jgi:hypothetical protein